MENPFKIGDVAILRSGGPQFIISNITANIIELTYFDTIMGGFHRHSIDARCVRHATEKPEQPVGADRMRSTSVART